MNTNTTNATPATPQETEELVEQAKHEAQERVAELHEEEGSVRSEGGAHNSPSPEDIDPAQQKTPPRRSI